MSAVLLYLTSPDDGRQPKEAAACMHRHASNSDTYLHVDAWF